ncbi:MAG TPA: hypothetical protein VFT05_12765 [Burkholderiaceae bacterium]|nr:hypothetical protein [Burkholderiaceae bacterium]
MLCPAICTVRLQVGQALESLLSGSTGCTRCIDINSGWDDDRSPSLATLRIDHPVLTIYAAPLAAVPEPQAWMLLLLGLAPLALAKRHAAVAARPGAQSADGDVDAG